MAVRYWEGSASNTASSSVDWQEAANWSDDTVPTTGDVVIFDGRGGSATGLNGIGAIYDCLTGFSSAETGGSSAAPAIVYVKADYTGDIASASLPLHLGDGSGGANPVKIIYSGGGSAYIECSASAAINSYLELVICNTTSGTLNLQSDQNNGTSATSQITEVIATEGTLNIKRNSATMGCYVKTLRMQPKDDRTSNITVTVEPDCYDDQDASDIGMNIYMANGTLTTDSKINNIWMHNGTVNYGTDLGSSPETDLNIEELRMQKGTFNWYPDDSDDDAYIGKMFLFGGDFNANTSTNIDRAKVLGNGDGKDIYVFDGAVLNIANNRGNITIATNSQLWNYGGDIITDDGAEVTVSYHTT